MKRYNNYHRHSHKSNVFSPDTHIKNEDYAKRAIELGHTTLFSTEHGYGGDIFEIVDLANKYKLKPLYAIEGYIVPNATEKDNRNYHILIVPRSDIARKRLNLINSNANINGYYYKPRLFLNDLLNSDKDDFYITTACCGGILRDESGFTEIFLPLYNHFKDNIYLETQTHTSETQKKVNLRAKTLAKTLGLKLIHANDSHYIYPEDAKDRQEMLKGKNVNYGEEDTYILDYPEYNTIVDRYRKQGILTDEEIEEALRSTLIFDDINENIKIDKTIKMPNIYKDKTVEERLELLKYKIAEGYSKFKIADEIKPYEENLYIKAINEEFKVINDTKEIHTMDYFILNERIVDKAINEYGGYLTSTSRGSGGAFIINKALGLTQLDRVRAEIPLYYERFMSTARLLGDNPPYTSSLPDLDFNVIDPEPFRKASKDYLGEHGCYWMLAYGTMQEGESFRNICRAKGYNYDEYNEVAKDIDKYREDEKWKDVIKEAQKFNGVVISSSPHPCSNILFSGDLREELGVIKVGDAYCCPITSTEADDWHYLKNDYLTVESIKLTKLTYDMLGKPVDTLYQLKNKLDNKVWDIYGKGLTCAINQFDSLWATSMSKQYKPKNIKEVSLFNGAIRPNFNDYRDSFMNRDNSFTNGNSFLDEMFEKTDKYCLYQENLMSYFEKLGISPSESIGLIKKISKKKIKQKDFDALVERLKNGWINQVGSMKDFDETWNKIQTFMLYGYNTPHSLAMAYDSLYNAYLKSHYPLEYYSIALENYKGDNERTNRLTKELQNFNISIKPPKFRYSKHNYFPDKETKTIYKGLSSIKYLNETIGEELYSLRNNKYDTFIDLLKELQNTSINSRQLDILIKLHFFDEFGGADKLLKTVEIYNSLNDKKQFKKDKLPLGLTEDILKEYTNNETPKTFTQVDTDKLMHFLVSILEDKDITMKQIFETEKEYVGYISYTSEAFNERVFVVTEIKENKWGSIFITLYRINNGISTTLKVDKRYFNQKPLSQYEMINVINIDEKPKKRKIDGKWINLDEKEFILTSYSKIIEEEVND